MKNNAIVKLKPNDSRLNRILILGLVSIKKFDSSNLESFIPFTIRLRIVIINATEISQLDQFRNVKITKLAEWTKKNFFKYLVSEPLQYNKTDFILLVVNKQGVNLFFFPTDIIKKEVVKYEI